MKTKVFFKLLAFAAFISVFALGCQRQTIQEELADQTAYAKAAPSIALEGDTPEGATCCSVFGASQPICQWATDVSTVLNCCHIETPDRNCSWSNYYQTATYEIHPTYIFSNSSASFINGQITATANFAQANRPANFKIYSYTVTPNNTPAGCLNLIVTITYRRFICEAINR
jgi:hypothetical protein